MSASQNPSPADPSVLEARRREIASEHLLFGTLRHLAGRDPTLVDALESSVDHLWDHGPAETRDDEAVRDIARAFIRSLRSVGRDQKG